MSGLVNAIFGGNDAPQPDPQIGEAAKANSAIAGRAQDLAEKQYADQQALVQKYLPVIEDQIRTSLDAQKKSTSQSDQQWQEYLDTFMPVEKELAAKSLAYAAPGRIDQAGQEAGGRAAEAVDNAITDSTRGLIASGASPEKIAALQAAQRVSGAKTIAGAEQQGRSDAESKSMAYLDNAARFGRNMPSTGIATAQLAGQQGSQAVGNVGASQQVVATPTATTQPLLSTAISGNQSAGSLYNTQYQGQLAAYNAQNAFLGDLIGAGAKLYGYSQIRSSQKAKHVGKRVDGRAAADAVEKSPASHWRYRKGLGDGSEQPRMGPMAEDVHRVAPKVSDGETIDVPSALGLHHAAIGNLSKRVRSLEKRKGL